MDKDIDVWKQRNEILHKKVNRQMDEIKKLNENSETIFDLARKYPNKTYVELEKYTPKVPYRETITGNAVAKYRHKKQQFLALYYSHNICYIQFRCVGAFVYFQLFPRIF